jgi:hypothetical protein
MISSGALGVSGFRDMKRRENGRKNARIRTTEYSRAKVALITGVLPSVAVYRSIEYSGVNTYTRKQIYLA